MEERALSNTRESGEDSVDEQIERETITDNGSNSSIRKYLSRKSTYWRPAMQPHTTLPHSPC